MKLAGFFCYLLITFGAYSQDTIRVEAHRVSDEEIIRIKEEWDFNQEKNWKFFRLKDTLTITVVEHLPAPGKCGTLQLASVTIGKTG